MKKGKKEAAKKKNPILLEKGGESVHVRTSLHGRHFPEEEKKKKEEEEEEWNICDISNIEKKKNYQRKKKTKKSERRQQRRQQRELRQRELRQRQRELRQRQRELRQRQLREHQRRRYGKICVVGELTHMLKFVDLQFDNVCVEVEGLSRPPSHGCQTFTTAEDLTVGRAVYARWKKKVSVCLPSHVHSKARRTRDEIRSRFLFDCFWNLGTITSSCNADSTFDILFDDGESKSSIPLKDIQTKQRVSFLRCRRSHRHGFESVISPGSLQKVTITDCNSVRDYSLYWGYPMFTPIIQTKTVIPIQTEISWEIQLNSSIGLVVKEQQVTKRQENRFRRLQFQGCQRVTMFNLRKHHKHHVIHQHRSPKGKNRQHYPQHKR